MKTHDIYSIIYFIIYNLILVCLLIVAPLGIGIKILTGTALAIGEYHLYQLITTFKS